MISPIAYCYTHTHMPFISLLIINNLPMRTVLLLSVVLLLAFANDLGKAKFVERVGDFLRKRTKFGEVFLHKESGDYEEVVL